MNTTQILRRAMALVILIPVHLGALALTLILMLGIWAGEAVAWSDRQWRTEA